MSLEYASDIYCGAASPATGGGSSSTTPITVAVIDQTTTAFPTTRPDGSALILGDIVRPSTSASFPFSVGGINFTNSRDYASYGGSGTWFPNASAFQKTSEVPVTDKTTESLSGLSALQSTINIENVEALKKRVVQSTEDTKNVVYVRNTGTEGVVEYSNTETASTIAERYTDGRLKVGNPVDDKDAVNKSTLTTELAKKVDKSTVDDKDLAYVRRSGTEGTVEFADTAVPSTLAIRDASGNVRTGAAADREDAINKAVFDTALALKVDKITDTSTYDVAYTHKTDGSEGYLGCSENYTDVSTLVKRKSNGHILVPNTPTNSNDAVSKKYCDNLTGVDDVTLERQADTNKLQVKNAGIGTSQIANGAVTLEKLETQATTDVDKIAVVQADGKWALGVNADVDNTTIEKNASKQLQIKDSGVVTAKIADSAVTFAKIKTQDATDAYKVLAVKTDGTWGLEVNADVDDVTIEKTADRKLQIKDDGVTTAKIADDTVTLAKLKTQALTEVGKAIVVQADGKFAVTALNDLIQYATMPTASADFADKWIQYVGPTTGTGANIFRNGYFYKCALVDSEYKWLSSLFSDTYFTNTTHTESIINEGDMTSDTLEVDELTVNESCEVPAPTTDTQAARWGSVKERIKHYTTMPTPSAALVDEGPVQYVGTTTPQYTTGYFYKCQGSEESGYQYVSVPVQAVETVGNVLQQYSTMPTASSAYLAKFVQYIGFGAAGLKRGHIYTCELDTSAGYSQYIWKEAPTQEDLVDDVTIAIDGTTSKKYVKDSGIKTAQLGLNAVTAEKIANDAVTEYKLADSAVSSDKLADEAVTEAKIAEYSITVEKLKSLEDSDKDKIFMVNSAGGWNLQNLFDKVYPVGAIYETTGSLSPSSLFGGTWETLPDRYEWNSESISQSDFIDLDGRYTMKEMANTLSQDGIVSLSFIVNSTNYGSTSIGNIKPKYRPTSPINSYCVMSSGQWVGTYEIGYMYLNSSGGAFQVEVKNGKPFAKVLITYKLADSTADRTYKRYKRTA